MLRTLELIPFRYAIVKLGHFVIFFHGMDLVPAEVKRRKENVSTDCEAFTFIKPFFMSSNLPCPASPTLHLTTCVGASEMGYFPQLLLLSHNGGASLCMMYRSVNLTVMVNIAREERVYVP